MLLLEALGFPIPGALALLATGAAVASGAMQLTIALPVAVLAMLAGDFILYIAGRYSGWGLLGVLCGISVSPEVCILRSAKWFYQRGRMTLVVAKFIPGVNTMAPPLAGSMNMRAAQFLPLDLAGVLCYVFAYGSVGFVFSDMLQKLVGNLQAFGRVAEWLLLAGVAVYAGYRIWNYARHRLDRRVRRVTVADVVARQGPMIIADVRSHGYYDSGAQRVRGSIRLEPNNLDAVIDSLAKNTPIYLYCT